MLPNCTLAGSHAWLYGPSIESDPDLVLELFPVNSNLVRWVWDREQQRREPREGYVTLPGSQGRIPEGGDLNCVLTKEWSFAIVTREEQGTHRQPLQSGVGERLVVLSLMLDVACL